MDNLEDKFNPKPPELIGSCKKSNCAATLSSPISRKLQNSESLSKYGLLLLIIEPVATVSAVVANPLKLKAEKSLNNPEPT